VSYSRVAVAAGLWPLSRPRPATVWPRLHGVGGGLGCGRPGAGYGRPMAGCGRPRAASGPAKCCLQPLRCGFCALERFMDRHCSFSRSVAPRLPSSQVDSPCPAWWDALDGLIDTLRWRMRCDGPVTAGRPPALVRLTLGACVPSVVQALCLRT
jgi:hypothetical protein